MSRTKYDFLSDTASVQVISPQIDAYTHELNAVVRSNPKLVSNAAVLRLRMTGQF